MVNHPAGEPFRRTPRLAVLLSELNPLLVGADLSALVGLASHAETVGADAVFVGEHVVMGARSDSQGPPHPYEPLRPGKIAPTTPWLEPLVTLGAVAGATSTISLGTAILIAPLRPPVLLAKQLATLDVLSRGRLEVGLGVSWHEAEYQALGVPFHQRGRRLDEFLALSARLWEQDSVTTTVEGADLDRIHLEPKPTRQMRMWFGGTFSPRMMDRVARYGSGLAPLPRLDSEDLSALRSHMEGVGRSADELDLITGIRPITTIANAEPPHRPADLESSLASIPELAEFGYTTFVLWPNVFTDRADELPDVITSAIHRFAALTRSGMHRRPTGSPGPPTRGS